LTVVKIKEIKTGAAADVPPATAKVEETPSTS